MQKSLDCTAMNQVQEVFDNNLYRGNSSGYAFIILGIDSSIPEEPVRLYNLTQNREEHDCLHFLELAHPVSLDDLTLEEARVLAEKRQQKTPAGTFKQNI